MKKFICHKFLLIFMALFIVMVFTGCDLTINFLSNNNSSVEVNTFVSVDDDSMVEIRDTVETEPTVEVENTVEAGNTGFVTESPLVTAEEVNTEESVTQSDIRVPQTWSEFWDFVSPILLRVLFCVIAIPLIFFLFCVLAHYLV